MGEERKNVNIILVGSNPLPCYIQAAYVLQGVTEEEEEGGLRKPDMIVFVVTEETGKYAEYMKSVLLSKKLEHGLEIADYKQIVITDIYDAAEIEETIKNGLEEINKVTAIGHILLNNTGGTKTMAVYATEAVRGFSQENVEVTECFVDPIKDKIRCYTQQKTGTKKKNQTLNFPVKDDLREHIDLGMEDLIFLHYGTRDIKYDDLNGKDKEGNGYKKLTDKQLVFAKDILCKNEVYKSYSDFFRLCKGKKGKLQEAKKLEKIAADEKNKRVFEAIETYFKKDNGKIDFSQLEVFTQGTWLEKYFYEVLLEVKEQYKEKKIQTVWSCKVKSSKEGKEFEVDVLVLRGYALTLFSISMVGDGDGEESMAKGKYFEAVYRVEQMAGEHGKAVIVNFLPDAENILKNFAKDLSMFNKEVKPIYRKKLGNMEGLKEDIQKILGLEE